MTLTLLAILPNWNSLDSVRQAHSDLEAAGLAFFFLLVVAEALAHNSRQEKWKHRFNSIGIGFFAIAVLCEIGGYWYGERNDALSERVISSLDAKAQKAADNASTALTNSTEAENKSTDALGKAGKAQEKADAAVNSSGEAKAKASAVDTQVLSAKEQLDELDAKRKALEASIAPRPILWRIGTKDGANTDPLEPYGGTNGINVFLEYLPAAEGEVTSLVGILGQVKWNLVSAQQYSVVTEGVTIWRPPSPFEDPEWVNDGRTKLAADALCRFLIASGWDTNVEMGLMDKNATGRFHIPTNTLRIAVGRKPEPYFDPSWIKESNKKLDDLRKTHGEWRCE